MDTRTGEIFELPPNTTLDEFAEQVAKVDKFQRTPEQIRKDMVRIGRRPNPECPKCCGRGYLPKGLNSKRYKACECTKQPFLP